MSTAGAAVAVFGGQPGEAGDGVEVGVMGARLGEGAQRGQRRQHWEPGGRKTNQRGGVISFYL